MGYLYTFVKNIFSFFPSPLLRISKQFILSIDLGCFSKIIENSSFLAAIESASVNSPILF